MKTRLTDAFGNEGAAALYEAFVDDTISLCERVREIGRVDIALWTTAIDHPSVSEWSARIGAAPRLQPEGDLGVRMSAAFEDGLRRYERVVLIGSDAPTLPLSLIVAAFDALEDASVVLGPANDGGFYVIGAARGVVPSLDAIAWSTPSALRDTLNANAHLGPALLSPWYDVDEPADVNLLRAQLSVDPSAAPATRRRLDELAFKGTASSSARFRREAS